MAKQQGRIKETKLSLTGLKSEIDSFKDTQNQILSLLEQQVTNKQEGVSNQTEEVVNTVATAESSEFPRQYRSLVEKYFDPRDGFDFRLTWPEIDDKGRELGGLLFLIVVPRKFSNATDAYLEFYHTDIRPKALQPGDIAGGIDRYCQMVAKNLGYDKNVKTK